MTIPYFVYTFNSILYTFQIVLMTLLVRWQSSQPVHNIAAKYDSLHHPDSVLFSYSLRANRNMLAYYSLRNLIQPIIGPIIICLTLQNELCINIQIYASS